MSRFNAGIPSTFQTACITTGTEAGEYDEKENAVVEFKNLNSNIGEFGGDDRALAQFKYDSSNDTFKLSKQIDNSDTLTDIMTVDKKGFINFNTAVNFNGGGSTLSTTTTSIQDQQLEIGLADSINITGVYSTGSGPYSYIFQHNSFFC